MRLRTLAATAGLTLALGLALPEAARADGRSCRRSYGYASSYRYAPSYRYSTPYVGYGYSPAYAPYAYDAYPYDPYYAQTFRPGYYVRRPVPLVVYRRVPYRRPHVNISIGF